MEYPLTEAAVQQATTDVAQQIAPAVAAVNPVTNRIYVANNTANTVSVIDGASNSVIATLETGGGAPCAIGVNPATNRVYVANYASSSISVLRDSMSGVAEDSLRLQAARRKLKATVLSGASSAKRLASSVI